MQDFKLDFYAWSDRIIRIINISFIVASIIALTSLIAQYGFYISVNTERWLERLNLLFLLFYVLQFSIKLVFIRQRLSFMRRHWFETSLVVLIILRTLFLLQTLGIDLIEEYFININVPAITKVTIIYAQIAIILSIISGGLRLNSKIASLKFHPAQTLLLSFLTVIIIGSLLLLLPKATVAGKSLSLLDAIFTSTSATCVTGLVVVDTGSHFSQLGQLIILFLIQIGGLGIMTLSSFLAMFFGRGIAIRERVMLQEMMNIDRLGIITKTLRQVVLITIGIEIAGSILLFFSWNNVGWDLTERIYHSVFHSVSAFCNAGFSLNSDSLIAYQSNYPVLLTIASLVILGGLGFVVLIEIGGGHVFSMPDRRSLRRWSLQAKLVFIISGLLLIAGTIFLFILGTGQGTFINRFFQSFFSAVTARTAGFNTIDFGLLSTPVILLIIVLMFIGASPGSTGGGIKTTTLGILFASLLSIITGKSRIELFKKSISYTVLNRALVIFAFSITVITVSTFLLSITEPAPFLDILFEEVSAFGTVGLSRGLTAQLSQWGKIIIILSMFIGRIGALTLAFAITAPKERMRVEYPEERSIMVG